jgi:hypothetical protein
VLGWRASVAQHQRAGDTDARVTAAEQADPSPSMGIPRSFFLAERDGVAQPAHPVVAFDCSRLTHALVSVVLRRTVYRA